jgi:hypothetical protein
MQGSRAVHGAGDVTLLSTDTIHTSNAIWMRYTDNACKGALLDWE